MIVDKKVPEMGQKKLTCRPFFSSRQPWELSPSSHWRSRPRLDPCRGTSSCWRWRRPCSRRSRCEDKGETDRPLQTSLYTAVWQPISQQLSLPSPKISLELKLCSSINCLTFSGILLITWKLIETLKKCSYIEVETLPFQTCPPFLYPHRPQRGWWSRPSIQSR